MNFIKDRLIPFSSFYLYFWIVIIDHFWQSHWLKTAFKKTAFLCRWKNLIYHFLILNINDFISFSVWLRCTYRNLLFFPVLIVKSYLYFVFNFFFFFVNNRPHSGPEAAGSSSSSPRSFLPSVPEQQRHTATPSGHKQITRRSSESIKTRWCQFFERTINVG